MACFIVAWLAVFLTIKLNTVHGQSCSVNCPRDEKMVCGFNEQSVTYKCFANKCSMKAYDKCYKTKFDRAPMKFCLESAIAKTRRYYHESCPVFCPEHYRPVCATPRYRGFSYRTFKNKCFLQMLNCRGEDDLSYQDVPIHYCQRHLMKNIFKERVVVSNHRDYINF